MPTLMHPVPREFLAHIGDITVSFVLLESEIASLIWFLLGRSQRVGQIVTAELSFKGLLALAISLHKERYSDGAGFSVLQELMTRAARLEEERNRIIHSIWAAGTSPETVTRVKTTARAKRGIHFEFVSVSERDLARFADELKRLAFDVQRYGLRLAGMD